MELATRRVIWFAVIDRPDAEWVTQQARNVSWDLQQLGVPARFLLHDHDAKNGGGSDRVFAGDGVSVIRTPIVRAKGQFTHGAPNWLDPAGVSGLDPDPQSSAPGARPD